jgi:hypothetical protein
MADHSVLVKLSTALGAMPRSPREGLCFYVNAQGEVSLADPPRRESPASLGTLFSVETRGGYTRPGPSQLAFHGPPQYILRQYYQQVIGCQRMHRCGVNS